MKQILTKEQIKKILDDLPDLTYGAGLEAVTQASQVETCKAVGEHISNILLSEKNIRRRLKRITDLVADYLKRGEFPDEK